MEEMKPHNDVRIGTISETMTNMQREYWRYAGMALIFALLFVVCLYKNVAGVTAPFFSIGILALLYFFARINGIEIKKSAIPMGIAIVSFGISSFLTTNGGLLFFNYVAGIFILGLLVISHLYDIDSWKGMDYFLQFLNYGVGILENLMACFSMHKVYKKEYAVQREKKGFHNTKVFPVILGVACAIPAVIFVGCLLMSSDAVFGDMGEELLASLFGYNWFGNIFGIGFWFVSAFLCFYAMLYYFAKKQNTEYAAVEIKQHEPLIAIGFLAPFLIIYAIFSWIQIGALFLGNMSLPENYTYAEYAREGFWQLLFVCMINFGIVMICYSFFRESKVLKVLQTLMVGCTYIMILSAAFRMGMYVEAYGLTRKRVLVFWALAVLAALFIGVTIAIWRCHFSLFRFGTVVVIGMYLCLSLSHMDYWIAHYNLFAHPDSVEMELERGMKTVLEYLEEDVSLDAAPMIFKYYDQEKEWKDDRQMKYEKEDYEERIKEECADMGWRNFNFSKWMAER